jgi:putative heme-binding domain-containing protein
LGGEFAGDPARGRKVFLNTCASCHTLFGEGGRIGPDLSAANRRDTTFMVENILFPSLTIRPEFVSYNVTLKDGRALSGFVVDSNQDSLTIRDIAEQKTVVSRGDLSRFEASTISLMPPGLLEAMQPQEVRDLFAYLQADPPVPGTTP